MPKTRPYLSGSLKIGPSKQAVPYDRALHQRNESGYLPNINIHYLGSIQWTFQKNYTWQLHRHTQYELIIPEKGIYRCSLNGENLSLKKGEVLIVQTGNRHQDICDANTVYTGIGFNITDENRSHEVRRFLSNSVTPNEQIAKIPFAFLQQALKSLADESEQNAFASAQIQDAIFAKLFWQLIREIPQTRLLEQFRNKSNTADFQARLNQLFQKKQHEPLSVPEMAKGLNMSVRNLTLKCDLTFGLSPALLFRQFKLEQAKRLLAFGDMTVKEVSYSLGFKNPYHFSRAFKAMFSVAPKNCKRK